MSIVAGVDFGTLNVRVSIFDKTRGRLGDGVGDYPVHRMSHDPHHATQSHFDHMDALTVAVRGALFSSGVQGSEIRALALDTTGSSVIIVDSKLEPLSEYYLWCDHRSVNEAAEITAKAHEKSIEAIKWCGGSYSAEWGWSKVLHWLRHNPSERARFGSALEHCDMVVAKLCGITSLSDLPRSICAMGHKWMWNSRWGGLPSEEFLVSVDPLLGGIRDKIAGSYKTSDQIAGHLSPEWAERLGLAAGIPIPVGALDAHWDAIGANIRLGDAVNVIGTSTCIMAITKNDKLIPGLSGVVPGSIVPGLTGIEAGLSAVGSMLESIASRAHSTVQALTQGLEGYRAGQTGLLRIPWDNGDRTILGNSNLGGITFGWNLLHTAQDEFFAAIEGTAFHTRLILQRLEDYDTPIKRIINAGGLSQHNKVLNQIYANVMNCPVLVASKPSTSLGAAIFAFLAAGDFRSIADAQDTLCPSYDVYVPQPEETLRCQQLYDIFKEVYHAFGNTCANPAAIGSVLPNLRMISRDGFQS